MVLLARSALKDDRQPTVSNKYLSKFLGPFRVVNVNTERDNYTLELPPQMNIHPTFHVSQLRAYVNPNTVPDIPRQISRPEAINIEENRFEVEQILQTKGKGRNQRWLVKWKGYDASENSWEPRAHLKGAEESLAEFQQKTKKPPSR